MFDGVEWPAVIAESTDTQATLVAEDRVEIATVLDGRLFVKITDGAAVDKAVS
jgi:hypothetical protein